MWGAAAKIAWAREKLFPREIVEQIEIGPRWHVEVLEVTPREKFSTARVRARHRDRDYGEFVMFLSEHRGWVPLEPHPDLQVLDDMDCRPFEHPIVEAIVERMYAIRQEQELAEERSHVRDILASETEEK